MLENESASTTFGPGSPAPYLAHTLTARGAFLPNYYGVGHHSLDNYIAMISGQAPNPDTDLDCLHYVNFPTNAIGAHDQQKGQRLRLSGRHPDDRHSADGRQVHVA